MSTKVPFEIGVKGRVVIPVAVRREAGVEVGQTLVARAEGPGRIVMETPEAIQARVWAAAPDRGQGDAVSDIRALRDEDNRLADAAAERRSARWVPQGGSTADPGERLLTELGL